MVIKSLKIKILLIVSILLWIILHIPGVIYGTKDLPLHQSYVGDEQAPINGALHMLEEKSILGIRNHATAYYGPVFSIISIPPIVLDAGIKFIKGEIHNANDYKNSIIFDWGEIVLFSRMISVLCSILLLFSVYFYLKPKEQNNFSKLAFVGVLLVASNYYVFEYSHFFKHWIYIITTLTVQWWSLRIILEKRGGKIWWFIHWLATFCAIGISYFSAINLVMWIPVLLKWLKGREYLQLKYFFRLTYVTIISTLLSILWHPIIIIRYLGIAGVKSVSSSGGSAGVQNLFNLSDTSFDYYSNILFLNHLPIIFVLVIFTVLFWEEKIYKRIQIWILLLPGIFNFLLFVPPAHHEGRYMLPSILSMLLLTGFLLIEYWSKIKSKVAKVFIAVLLGVTVLIHLVNIVGWIKVYAEGPVEQAMITKVLDKAKEGKSKVLLVQNYIAGHVHTKEAYARYARGFKKENFNLYKEIADTPAPEGLQLLDATYILEKDYLANEKIGDKYDQVVLLKVPRKDLKEINQFDFIDENIFRVWNYFDLMPTYTYIK